MAIFENDLAQYESVLGAITGQTLKLWYKRVPDLDERYTKLITETITYRGRYCPLGYKGPTTGATPVKAHMLAIIIAMAKNQFEKRYSLQECVDLLSQVGLSVSRMGIKKVFPRISDALGLTEHIPDKDIKVVKIESLADAEALVQRERKNYAKKALKEGKSGEEVREEMTSLRKKGLSRQTKKTEQTIESKEDMESEDFKGREIIYEPTPKQMEFHAASEKVVLYGGAAG